MNTYTVKTKDLCSGYDKKRIINHMNIEIAPNKISIIIGANGSGKSTLLKSLCRLLPPTSGEIQINHKNIRNYPNKKLAQILGLLPQSPVIPEGISVAQLISRGRFPYREPMKNMSKKDYEAIEEAMELMKVTPLADRDMSELSGGQRQRVWIALALAQDTDILFLDEPTTYLDIAYQIEILDLLTELNRKKGTTIVMVLHDINLSARYGDHLFALSKGKLHAQGIPKDIINEALIQEVYGLSSKVIQDPLTNCPMILPIGKYHTIGVKK